MSPETSSLDTLKDIKKMMERSSRFISLSGWSGIAAGICALAGCFFVWRTQSSFMQNGELNTAYPTRFLWNVFIVATLVFISAFITAFLFTYRRSRRDGIPIWGITARRLLWNTLIPMLIGGIVILEAVYAQHYYLVAPYSLIFYGLALLNGSKYTLGEIRYLGYIEIAIGIINLWLPGQWLLLWALGFGIMHIVYGLMMWWKYERKSEL